MDDRVREALEREAELERDELERTRPPPLPSTPCSPKSSAAARRVHSPAARIVGVPAGATSGSQTRGSIGVRPRACADGTSVMEHAWLAGRRALAGGDLGDEPEFANEGGAEWVFGALINVRFSICSRADLTVQHARPCE